MAVGQSGKKTGAVIQARMQSTRLPGKIIMPLPFPDGKPLLQQIIEALKRSRHIDEIILATSVNPENDVLENIASDNNIHFFRGDEADVLSRFVAVIDTFKLDTLVRLTADNPILDIPLLDQLIAHHQQGNHDYTYSTHLPLGMNMEIVESGVLKEIMASPDITDEDREHVTIYIGKSGKYKAAIQPLWPVPLEDSIRLTVDYPVDFALSSLLFNIAAETQLSGMELICWIDKNYPWIWEINRAAYQRNR